MESSPSNQSTSEFFTVEMGHIDQDLDDLKYLITDKDTGEVYDLRNDEHLSLLTSHTKVANSIMEINPRSDWSQWWQQKKKNL
jgi:hypothetical protein